MTDVRAVVFDLLCAGAHTDLRQQSRTGKDDLFAICGQGPALCGEAQIRVDRLACGVGELELCCPGGGGDQGAEQPERRAGLEGSRHSHGKLSLHLLRAILSIDATRELVLYLS